MYVVPNRFNILIIYKTSLATVIFSVKFLEVFRKEPEPQVVISAPASGVNLISAPAPQFSE
jgi:hypothetical protein